MKLIDETKIDTKLFLFAKEHAKKKGITLEELLSRAVFEYLVKENRKQNLLKRSLTKSLI